MDMVHCLCLFLIQKKKEIQKYIVKSSYIRVCIVQDFLSICQFILSQLKRETFNQVLHDMQ